MSIEELKEWMEEKFKDNKEDHMAIKNRVDTTNGRVTSLERWRYTIIGAFATLTFLVTILGIVVQANSK